MALDATELQVRWLWSNQLLAVQQVPTGALRVGPGTGCDLVPELESAVELARCDDGGWTVQAPAGRKLILDDGFDTRSQRHARVRTLRLEGRDRAILDFGALRAELSLTDRPRQVGNGLFQPLDLHFLYLLLMASLGIGLAMISGGLEGGDDTDFEGPLLRNPFVLRSIDIRPPPKPVPTASTTTSAARSTPSSTPKSASKPSPHPAAHDRRSASRAVEALFSGPALSSVLGSSGLGAGLASALEGVGQKSGGVASGIEGLALRGGPPGGGPGGHTIGIGSLVTHHGPDYGPGGGLCGPGGCKPETKIGIDEDHWVITGSMDKELIREVIHRNRAQIRFCYEQSLVTSPQLNGKVDVHFVIAADGSVLDSEVEHSTTHAPVLDGCLASRFKSWLFPKPKGGGVVEVTYPIILQRSGGL